MSEIRRSSELRQAELTDAALHIIATQGIAALSTRKLAEHVGLSSGAIFRHFPSLDALLDAVVCRVEMVLESTFPPNNLKAFERLMRFVEARSSTVGNQLGILRLVLSEQFLLALPKDGSARLYACVEKTRAFLSNCIREGQSEGEIREDIEANALAVVLMGSIQMLALSAAHPEQRGVDPQMVRDALSKLLQAPSVQKKYQGTKTKKI